MYYDNWSGEVTLYDTYHEREGLAPMSLKWKQNAMRCFESYTKKVHYKNICKLRQP